MAYMGDASPSGSVPFVMSTSQIADFLSRNPVLALQAAATAAYITLFGYDQIAVGTTSQIDTIYKQLDPSYQPGTGVLIPEWGICTSDPTYGGVLVSLDASGNQHYTGNVSTGICGQIAQAPYISDPNSSPPTGGNCPGLTNVQNASDLLACVNKGANEALLIGAAIVALMLFRK